MVVENDDFGKGIFDDDIANVDDSDTAVMDAKEPEEEKIELTDREIAIARGEDPDESEAKAKAAKEKEPPKETDDEPLPEEESPKWSISDVRLAKAYGLEEDDLQKFDSPQSLHAAIDLLESRTDAGKKDQADSPSDPASSDADDSKDGAVSNVLGFEKTDVEAIEKRFNALDEDGDRIYDEESAEHMIAQAKHARKIEDALEAALKRIDEVTGQSEQATLEQQYQNNQRQFNQALDDIPGMYGKGEELSNAQQAARQQIADHVETLYAGYLARNVDPPSIPDLVKQAVTAVHSKELTEAQKRIERLQQQSKQRRSPGSKVTPSKQTPPDQDPYSPEAIANAPDLVEFFENAQLENG